MHYSIRTEQAYVDWARRVIHGRGKRHPRDIGRRSRRLSHHLATNGNVSLSTQNQAKAAILFLYIKCAARLAVAG